MCHVRLVEANEGGPNGGTTQMGLKTGESNVG
jgi:hypothetical protein